MELKQQVVSLELAQKIKFLGFMQKSMFSWYCYTSNDISNNIKEEWKLYLGNAGKNDISAFTVAELGVILPKHYSSLRRSIEGKDVYICYNTNEENYLNSVYSKTEADARAKMLVYLLENELITK